ncbi:MAG: chemotaxis protein CheV, partial [Aeromonas veronii]
MASILDSVDQRTQLVGENRLELLMFRLGTRQMFAINVFKVREVVKL